MKGMGKDDKRKRLLYIQPKESREKYKSTIPKQTRSRWKKTQQSNKEAASEQTSSKNQTFNTESSYKATDDSSDHSHEGVADKDEENLPTTSLHEEKKEESQPTTSLPEDNVEEANSVYTDEDHAVNDEDANAYYTDEDHAVNDEDDTVSDISSEEDNVDVSIYNENDKDNSPNKVHDNFHNQNVDPTVVDIESENVDSELKYIAMLLGLKVKHSLTKVCVEDICKFVNLIIGQQVLPPTYHRFKAKLNHFQSPVQIHNFCSDCGKHLGEFENKNDTIVCVCGKESIVHDNVRKGNFFLHLPLKPQIKHVLQNRKLNLKLKGYLSKDKKVLTNIEDIHDGEMYEKTFHDIQHHLLDEKQILTLNANTDGVPVFSSSNYSMYPVLCSINNLPPILRKKYILLSSLWFGDKKPDMNQFLKPFVAELNELAKDGVEYTQSDNTTSVCHVFCMAVICDSVARPTVQNMVQFNGKFGCSYCLHPGEVVAKGKGFCRIYPQKEVQNRTHDEWLKLLNEMETNKAILKGTKKAILKGIKGWALILDVASIDIVQSFSPDYMHSVLLGVVRQFYTLWFDTKYHEMPWYLGNKQEEVNKRLLNIKPPYYLSRTPRALKTHKYWKAHEWYNWLLYYSMVILKGVLPTKYLFHWAFLVNSMYVLLQESVSKSEVHMAEKALEYFHTATETLYGREHSSFNLHLCTHLALSVKNWGPLWAHSGFVFENYNGILLSMVKSSRGVSHQIMTSFQDQQILTVQNLNTNPDAKFLLDHKSQLVATDSRSSVCVDGVTLFGFGQTTQISDFYRLAVVAASGNCIRLKETVSYYERIYVNHTLVHSSCYARVIKRNNYTVQLDDKEFFQVERFVVVNNSCFALGFYFCKIDSFLVPNLPPTVKLNHIVGGKILSSIAAVEAKKIARLTVYVDVGNESQAYICVPPNQYEFSM